VYLLACGVWLAEGHAQVQREGKGQQNDAQCCRRCFTTCGMVLGLSTSHRFQGPWTDGTYCNSNNASRLLTRNSVSVAMTTWMLSPLYIICQLSQPTLRTQRCLLQVGGDPDTTINDVLLRGTCTLLLRHLDGVHYGAMSCPTAPVLILGPRGKGSPVVIRLRC
jgi:hypothetical protein